jgi:hypothetical protein
MRPLRIFATSAQVPIRSERKMVDPRPATRRDYYEAPGATFLALAVPGQEHGSSHEGPLGCEMELLEEFLDAVAQVPNVTMSKKQ